MEEERKKKLLEWIDSHDYVLELIDLLKRIDELHGNSGAGAFWAGVAWAHIFKERDRLGLPR